MISNFFYNKKVLITGHTGFKGSWLTLWMYLMGAKVMGISNNRISTPSNFKILDLEKKIVSKIIDIRDYKSLKKAILNFEPQIIFHLAAESIVKRSFDDPKYAWETNTIGTLNILEVLRNYNKKVSSVIITSDKVYKNQEVRRGYLENDRLGSLDPYSASKASADLAAQSYIKTFLKNKKNIKIAIARAGNVVGGGDWSDNRLIPDCVRSWSKNKIVRLRNPKSTRPWQHVLDVLHGYILLLIKLNKLQNINGEVFNFGPKIEKNNTVLNIVKKMKLFWPLAKWKVIKKKNFLSESKLLHLNSYKAKKKLNWTCTLDLNKTIYFTTSWYRSYYENPKNIYKFSINQIKNFLQLSKIKN